MPTETKLQDAIERAKRLNQATQRTLGEEFLLLIDAHNELTLEQQKELLERLKQFLHAVFAAQSRQPLSGRRIYHGEEEFMRGLGMSEEQIARVMAEPVEPEPGEEYEHADL